MKTKVIFIEVRSKIELYELIAKNLKTLLPNIEIYWLVFNWGFRPKLFSENIIRLYPGDKSDAEEIMDEIDRKVISCDRFNIHKLKKHNVYKNVRKQIDQCLEKIGPSLVIGELGNFYTHYAALLAKKKGMPFVDIETARYPTGHFSLNQYDQWKPLRLKSVDDDAVNNYLIEFRTLKPTPDYMKKKADTKIIDNIREKKHKISLFKNYLFGEKYCTQNPIKNLILKRRVAEKIKEWELNSKTLDQSLEGKKILLYPMQMQPELNIEVWGYPYNNQMEIIRKLVKSLPKDWILVIKPNPNAYFEMLSLDFEEVSSNEKIILLPFAVAMNHIEPKADLVATVTGTIQIERLINKRPVYILGETPFKKYSSIKSSLENLTINDFESAGYSVEDSVAEGVVRYLLEHSAPGLISEPINDISCLSEANGMIIAKQLMLVLNSK